MAVSAWSVPNESTGFAALPRLVLTTGRGPHWTGHWSSTHTLILSRAASASLPDGYSAKKVFGLFRKVPILATCGPKLSTMLNRVLTAFPGTDRMMIISSRER